MRMQLCVLALACTVGLAQAKGIDSAALGKTLTPMGSEVAANADGSIPGLDRRPGEQRRHRRQQGRLQRSVCRRETVVHGHGKERGAVREAFSPGQIALFKRFPDTYKMNIYPSHRSANLPKEVLAASRENVAKTSMADGGNGLHDYARAFRFRCPPKAWR